MNMIHKIRALPNVLRYVIAVPVAGLTSIIILVCFGVPEKGSELLNAENVAAFAGLLAGGFCFPALSRWMHSAALLGLGVALFCFLRPIADGDYQWEFLPQFRVLIGGGSLAVAIHALLDLIHWTTRGLTRWPQRTRSSSLQDPDAGYHDCRRSAAKEFGR